MIRWFTLVSIFGLFALFFKNQFIYTLFYLSIILPAVSQWLLRFTFKRLETKPYISPKNIFYRESSRFTIKISNNSPIPIYWLEIIVYLPQKLVFQDKIGAVYRIPPKGMVSLDYEIKGVRRGCYELGPIILQSSDIISGEELRNEIKLSDRLLVYPKILPLTSGRLHSYQPIGELKSEEVAFEDPSRFSGIREYTDTDPIKRIHWKVSAHTGKLQVKVYEPTIGAQSVIFLNLRYQDYQTYDRDYKAELAVTLSSSLSAFLIEKKQAVGLVTNGGDMFVSNEDIPIQKIHPKQGEDQLIRILEVLARCTLRKTEPFINVIYSESQMFPRWMNLLVITPKETIEIIEFLLGIRHRGANITLFTLTNYKGNRKEEGIYIYEITNEDEIKTL
ncbi:MAG: DUF58 domain-containing protein [bacterium]